MTEVEKLEDEVKGARVHSIRKKLFGESVFFITFVAVGE